MNILPGFTEKFNKELLEKVLKIKALRSPVEVKSFVDHTVYDTQSAICYRVIRSFKVYDHGWYLNIHIVDIQADSDFERIIPWENIGSTNPHVIGQIEYFRDTLIMMDKSTF